MTAYPVPKIIQDANKRLIKDVERTLEDHFKRLEALERSLAYTNKEIDKNQELLNKLLDFAELAELDLIQADIPPTEKGNPDGE